MPVREKFFNTMRRKDGSYIPFEFDLCPFLEQEFKSRTGAEDYAEYFGFPTRFCGVEHINRISNEERFSQYFDSLDGIAVNEWGIGYRKGSMAHFTRMVHPMESFQTVGDFANYPYPDPVNDYDWESLPKKIKQIHDKDLISVAPMETTLFETAWYLRGMEEFLIDMIMRPDLANYHLDRIKEIKREFARRYTMAGVDIIRLGDDISTQLDMMIDPAIWRKFLKPRLAEIIKTAKDIKPDVLIFYHGDGNLQKVIPDLIEIGVDILNPVQPECMDPVEIKRKYGNRLSFWGTIGTQTTMPFSKPDEVKDTCRKMIEEVGKGGGLFLAPTHVLEPEVPWENIEAFIHTVNEHNKGAGN